MKQVDTQAPFLETVQLGSGGAPPRLETHGVVESVVAAPEVSHTMACWGPVRRARGRWGEQGLRLQMVQSGKRAGAGSA